MLLLMLSAQSCADDDTDLAQIKLPPGFAIEVYAEVPKARSLAIGENGTVFVSNRGGDSVYAVVPVDGGVGLLVHEFDTPT